MSNWFVLSIVKRKRSSALLAKLPRYLFRVSVLPGMKTAFKLAAVRDIPVFGWVYVDRARGIVATFQGLEHFRWVNALAAEYLAVENVIGRLPRIAIW